MSITKKLRTALFAITAITSAFAQPPLSFTKIQEEDGLSSGFVTTIFQDHVGFLWLGTPGALHRYDGYHFKVFQHVESDTLSLSNHEVWSIVEDKAGNIWIGTNNGLNRLNPRQETITRFKSELYTPESLTNNQIADLLADTAGTIWIATTNGLNRYFPDSGKFKRYMYEAFPAKDRPFRSSRTPIQTRSGAIWLALKDTLYRYNASSDGFTGIKMPGNNQEGNSIRLIYEDHEGYFWIGTQLNGAFRFDPHQFSFLEHYKNEPNNLNSLSHDKISAFIQNGDELWIGTTGGGLNVLNLKTKQITRYTGTPPDIFGVNSETIRDAWEDSRGNIWLGSFYDGLYQFKSSQRIFTNFDQHSGLLFKRVNDIEETDDGKVWICMGNNGLGILDIETKRFTNYYRKDSPKHNGLPSGNLVRMHRDEKGRLWVASETDGISYFDAEGGVFKKYLPKRPQDLKYFDFLSDLLIEANGDIWLPRHTGLSKYVQAAQSFQDYVLPDKKDTKINYGENNFVTSIFQDSQQRLWFTTYGGLNLYHQETDSFEFFPFQHQVLNIFEDSKGIYWTGTTGGLFNFDPEKHTYSKVIDEPLGYPLLEDKEGNIWVNAFKYLICYNPTSKKKTILNKQDGLSSNSYWRGRLSKSGYLLLCGIDGLTIFHPDNLETVATPPRVVLTDFQLFNRTVPLQGSRGDTLAWKSPLAQSITFTEKISLRYWQNYFSLEFAALDFTAPANNRYQYQLEGYDVNWTETTANRRLVTYTNLRPGTYTFKVKGAVQNSPWSEATHLRIEILPPWYGTWWAYLLWGTLIFGFIYTLYHFQLNRRLALAEANRLQELDVVKTKIYTNITHEFRTPLTVILGMAEQVQKNPKDSLQEGITLIKRNGKRLLELVNQMLDLAKLDANQLSAEYVQANIVPYIAYIVQSFESFAWSKKIRLHFLPKEESVLMDFDKEKLLQILTNLLSNAIKFTPENGDIYLQIEKQQRGKHPQLEITVKDTGEGIPLDQQTKIFERFQQVDDSTTRRFGGTGIGLALTKELVHLLNGTITVQSDLGKGATFIVTLPIQNEANLVEVIADVPKMNENMVSTTKDSEATETSLNLPVLLIIEDNADVITYLQACFKKDYRIEVAENGKIGIEKALELIPDIVISDVMMPEKDGFKVLITLKQDERTSHIPIVLLTAKADFASTIKGLERGADAYVSKPFNEQELRIRLNNLLEIRKRLQFRYAQLSPAPTEDKEIQIEDAFVAKVRVAILEHLDDENWKIPQLASQLRLSREHLHRKMKSLTGKSTSQFIRFVKMHQAKKLLETTDLNISEVAYRVGYKELAHFSAAYKEELGVSPSAVRK